MNTATIIRSIAVAIAIAAAVDPAITSSRTTQPEVEVVPVDFGNDSALVARVIGELGNGFSITPAPLAGADATVLVGDHLPTGHSDLAAPLFAVSSDRGGPSVAILAVDAPHATPIDARVPIVVRTRTAGVRGRKLDITLRNGDVVVDRVERTIGSDDEPLTTTLVFTPTGPGAVSLRVTAVFADAPAGQGTAADLAIDVRDRRWSVLFFDPRPSWQSTFVRRAIEGDDRFVVASRVVTSKNISTDAGSPPSSLDDLTGVGRFDAVIVGAPEALTDRDVTGLEAILRRRAGSVVLLFDDHVAGPYQRLIGTSPWSTNAAGRVESILPVTGDTAGLRAADIAWPTHLPDGATVLAGIAPTKGSTTPRAPIVWQLPVGAGRVIVSGALDAWKYRDASVSGFDAFWRNVVANAANAAPPPVTLSLSSSVLEPNESADVTVTVRDAALHPLPANADVSAAIEAASGDSQETVVLWPDGAPGELRGQVRAPMAPGVYRVAVTASGNKADAAMIVARHVARPDPDERALLATWVGAHGGIALSASRLSQLPAAIRAVVHPAPRPVRWHPMRAVWWLLPFAGCLSLEWYWRRKKGLR